MQHGRQCDIVSIAASSELQRCNVNDQREPQETSGYREQSCKNGTRPCLRVAGGSRSDAVRRARAIVREKRTATRRSTSRAAAQTGGAAPTLGARAHRAPTSTTRSSNALDYPADCAHVARALASLRRARHRAWRSAQGAALVRERMSCVVWGTRSRRPREPWRMLATSVGFTQGIINEPWSYHVLGHRRHPASTEGVHRHRVRHRASRHERLLGIGIGIGDDRYLRTSAGIGRGTFGDGMNSNVAFARADRGREEGTRRRERRSPLERGRSPTPRCSSCSCRSRLVLEGLPPNRSCWRRAASRRSQRRWTIPSAKERAPAQSPAQSSLSGRRLTAPTRAQVEGTRTRARREGVPPFSFQQSAEFRGKADPARSRRRARRRNRPYSGANGSDAHLQQQAGEARRRAPQLRGCAHAGMRAARRGQHTEPRQKPATAASRDTSSRICGVSQQPMSDNAFEELVVLRRRGPR